MSSKWNLGDEVYSQTENASGVFVEDNGDGTCAVRIGMVVMAVPMADLLTPEEYQAMREERRRNSLTWDELLNTPL